VTNPDALDLFLQGLAWHNKGPTSENLSRARGFFERALVLDPDNVDALVFMAFVECLTATYLLSADRAPHLAAAEAGLTKALSLTPEHAGAHNILGVVLGWTKRGEQGIAECERALAIDRNLARGDLGILHRRLLPLSLAFVMRVDGERWLAFEQTRIESWRVGDRPFRTLRGQAVGQYLQPSSVFICIFLSVNSGRNARAPPAVHRGWSRGGDGRTRTKRLEGRARHRPAAALASRQTAMAALGLENRQRAAVRRRAASLEAPSHRGLKGHPWAVQKAYGSTALACLGNQAAEGPCQSAVVLMLADNR
jgi:hypothetical protein